MKTKTFLVNHETKYGDSISVVKSTLDLAGSYNYNNPPNETIERLIEALDIDFEWEFENEWLEITELDEPIIFE